MIDTSKEMLFYSNPDVNISTIGRWIENEKVIIYYVNQKGETKKYNRKVYFDQHDLYITVKGNRYYYSEFQ